MCALIFVDNSITYITGEGEITNQQLSPYRRTNDIKSVILTDRCTGIGEKEFEGCSYLSSVTIPDTVTSIGVSSLSHTTSLKHISLPKSLKEINIRAFEDTALTELIIPEGTKFIKENAIYMCKKLETVVLPASLEEIGSNNLNYCNKLKTVKLYGKKSRIFSGLNAFLKYADKGLILYVDQSLVETYKQYRDNNGGQYNILPLE